MTIVDRIEAIRATKGNSGDDSFEYLGVTINEGIKSTKLYLKPNEKVMSFLKETYPYNDMLLKFNRFFCLEGIRICDISESTYEELKTHKIVFAFSRDLTPERMKKYVECFFTIIDRPILKEEILDTCSQFSLFIKSNTSLLQQLGIEFTDCGKIICIKYYINVKQSRQEKVTMTREFFCNLAKLLPLEHGLKRKDQLFCKLSSICNYNYFPVFIGVNAFENHTDYKLYMLSGASGYDNNTLLTSAKELFAKHGWIKYINERQLASIYENNLFAKGIACTLNDPDETRIYFGKQPRTLF